MSTPMPPLGRARAGLTAVLVLLGGCGSQVPTPSSSLESATPQPTASDGPTATATPTSTAVDEWSLAEIEDVPHAGFGGAFARGIAVGGPGLVAVGSVSPCCADVAYDDEPWSAVVWTSRDGRRWDLLPDLASFGRAGIVDVAVDDDGHMLAVGYEVLPPDPAHPEQLLRREMRLWRSSNGTDWLSVPAPEGEAQALAWGGGEWVVGGSMGAPGADAVVWTSTDLDTWTTESFGSGWINEVAASEDGTVIATGVFDREGAVPVTEALTRTVAGTWSQAELDGLVHDLVWHPIMGFVAVGYGEEDAVGYAASWSSTDGAEWRSSDFRGTGLASIDAVTAAGDTLFGVASTSDERGPTEAVWSTDAGASWTTIGRLEMPDGTGPLMVQTVAFRDAQYLVIGSRFVDGGGRTLAWHGP